MSSGTVIVNARVVTMGAGAGARRGVAMGDVGAIDGGGVVVRDGRVGFVGTSEEAEREGAGCERVDADGRVVLPGFVDAHTHLCWAGERLDEWEMKRRGATYLEILKSGGGIMSTVRSVRAASEDELFDGLMERLGAVLSWGTTAIEIKSGYGLDTENELKMLRAIARAREAWAGRVVATATIGHAIDAEGAGGRDAFIDRTVGETLDAVHAAFPGVAIDAYVEDGAWSLGEGVRLLERAMELGHPVRVHSDQFNDLGMTRWALEHGALSVDHLEATPPPLLEELAGSGTFGVMLPCSGFHVDGRYGDGRRFVDAGGALVLGTNWNPGSAPCGSVAEAIALGVRGCGVTAHEALCAVTRNGAALLGLDDGGRIEVGARGDLVMLRQRDERALGFEFGGSPVVGVWCGGERVFDGGVVR